jgi:hypothetical protein
MLTDCVNCGFFVEREAEFCLNCGIKSPAKDFSVPPPLVVSLARLARSNAARLGLSLGLTFLVLYLLADGEARGILYLRDYLLAAGVIAGAGGALLGLFFLNLWCRRKLYSRREKNPDNLTSHTKLIDKRLAELHRRGRTLDSIVARIDRRAGGKLAGMRPKLLAARELVGSQSARYELQKQKIELVRLQNRVSPYLFELHRLDDFELEHGLTALDRTKDEIERLRHELSSSAAPELPAPALPEKQQFFAQAAETEASLDKLREALLSRQAARALRGVSRLEEELTPAPEARDLAHAAETFNLQTALTDFGESFEELEREYRRVRTEGEVGGKLLEN